MLTYYAWLFCIIRNRIHILSYEKLFQQRKDFLLVKLSYKNIVFTVMSFSVVLLILGLWLNFYNHENTSVMNFSSANGMSYMSNPNFTIGDPIMNVSLLRYGSGFAKFIAYEDFPLEIPDYFNKGDVRIINLPDGIWAKLIPINDDDKTTLRLMGYVKPVIPNPLNQSLYLIERSDNTIYKVSVPIIKNGIIKEISIIRDSIPIKFNHELLANYNSTLFYLFGVVYDPAFVSDHSVTGENELEKLNMSELNVNIEPIGLMNDGKLVNFPMWLQLKTLRLPLALKENQPDYYVLGISTNNAPIGSYQVAVRETINQKIFIETITMTIINSTNIQSN
jgi:hypothetical protein